MNHPPIDPRLDPARVAARAAELADRPTDAHRAAQVRIFREQFEAVLRNVGRIIKGKEEVIRLVLLAMAADGHVLLKDVPGTGKTMLARSIAASIRLGFGRIQFTPDLLPMDITGSNVFDLRSKSFEFRPGPIFTNILLADEINRATPKTQSALLEVMAERQVTVEGRTHRLPPPFLVLATMNPLDHQGTYALPAAQMDRFSVQLSMGFPPPDAEMEMLDVHLARQPPVEQLEAVLDAGQFLAWQDFVPTIFIGEPVKAYLVALANAIRSDGRCLSPPSPRAVLMLARLAQARAMAEGRDYCSPVDVAAMAPHALAHRLVLSGDVTAAAYIDEMVDRVPVPA